MYEELTLTKLAAFEDELEKQFDLNALRLAKLAQFTKREIDKC